MEKCVYTVADIQEILGLGQSKAYKFVSECYKTQTEFRVIKVGNGVTQAIASFVKSIIKNALYAYANSKIEVTV